MPEKYPAAPEAANLLTEAYRSLRLTWRLLRDDRVPAWTKAIPAAAVAYVLFPLDLLIDPILGLGQLDDIAVAVLAVKMFIEACPPDIVQEHREALEGVVDADYRVVSDRELEIEPGASRRIEEPGRR